MGRCWVATGAGVAASHPQGCRRTRVLRGRGAVVRAGPPDRPGRERCCWPLAVTPGCCAAAAPGECPPCRGRAVALAPHRHRHRGAARQSRGRLGGRGHHADGARRSVRDAVPRRVLRAFLPAQRLPGEGARAGLGRHRGRERHRRHELPMSCGTQKSSKGETCPTAAISTPSCSGFTHYDLAVLKIGGDHLPVAALATAIRWWWASGPSPLAIPFGYLIEDSQPSVTAGVVSATRRDIRQRRRPPACYKT